MLEYVSPYQIPLSVPAEITILQLSTSDLHWVCALADAPRERLPDFVTVASVLLRIPKDRNGCIGLVNSA